MSSAAPDEATITLPRQTVDALHSTVKTLGAEVEQLRSQLDWFKRQVFGPKSEKRPAQVDALQAALFERQAAAQPVPEKSMTVPEHQRRKHRTGEEVNDSGLRFGPEVPVREIVLRCAQLDGPDADQYEVIDHKVSLRLARRPGAHVVLKYLRPVVRRKDDGAMATVPAPLGMLDHAQVDVSFVAGMIVDKFVYHLPIYRQHQRLADEGITVARSTIEQWVKRAIELLYPVVKAISERILSGGHIKMDETAIRAGRTKSEKTGRGRMSQGWLWPVLGEDGDIMFGYSGGRGLAEVKKFIGEQYAGTIQTDGYDVYARYAAKAPQCIHALCWSHTRRAFLKAEASEPTAVAEVLEMIRALYVIEKRLRKDAADVKTIVTTRKGESEPIVERIFQWINDRIGDPSLVPSSPLAKALGYAKEREKGLRVFLTDAWLDLDTNDLERALRVIPMGRKNWLFCTSEAGAEQVAAIQTILATCRAHDVDPYTYLVDVLQRINEHPASAVHELTPKRWRERFGQNPMRSDLERCQ